MSRQETHESSIVEAGKGDRLFLAFVGRPGRSSDQVELSAKSDPRNDFVGFVMLVLFGGMIAVTFWRLFFGAL